MRRHILNVLAIAVATFVPIIAVAEQHIPFRPTVNLIEIPVSIDGLGPMPALFDTGAGPIVISAALAKKLRIKTSGVYTGFRMAGERVDSPLAGPVRLKVGDLTIEVPQVTVWDGLDKLGLNALVSAQLFKTTPFTMDFGRRELVLEDVRSLAQRASSERSVPLLVRDDRDLSMELFAQFTFASKPGLCIIDSGSQGVFLNKRYATELGIDLASPTLKRVHTDQTDVAVAPIESLALSGYPETAIPNAHVMLSDLIYDCDVGTLFWKTSAVTIDIPNRRLLVSSLLD